MSELHWTGAALLLAVAVLGSKSSRRRRGANLNSAGDARQPGSGEAEHSTPDEPARGTATASTLSATRRPRRQRTARVALTVPPKTTQRRPAASVAANPWAGRLARSDERVLYRAETTCLHCGCTAGQMEWTAGAPGGSILLRPAMGEASQPVPRGTRLRCGRCGGPLFAERAERVVERSSVYIGPTRRGRPRKTTTLRVS
jgi:hypothetical protein